MSQTPEEIARLADEADKAGVAFYGDALRSLLARAEAAERALRKGIRWNDDGPCWCQTRRLQAVLDGTKVHTAFCNAARAALTTEAKPDTDDDGGQWDAYWDRAYGAKD